MGNCCAPARGKATNQERRLEKWGATGLVGLRDERLSQVPNALEGLGPAVRVLDASNNAILDLPHFISCFTNLQRLLLSNNRLSVLAPGLAALSGSLKVLLLDGNHLASLPPELGELALLEKLALDNNRLTSLPSSLGKLGALKELSVSCNGLIALPEELGDCASLEELGLASNALVRLPASLGRLTKLRTLVLDGNRLATVPSELLRGAVSLQTLQLHDNPIDAAALQAVDGFEEFESRRRLKYDKAIASGVLIAKKGMDEGVDRLT